MPSSTIYVRHGKNIRRDLSFLLEGVDEFQLNCPSVPSALLVHGPLAFSIAQDSHARTLFAAAHFGRGRVVVAPHEIYLSHPPLRRFMSNAVRWLAGECNPEKKVYVNRKLQHLYDNLQGEGFVCMLSELTDGAGVYCCTSYSDYQAEEIHQFVAEGGGLLIGGHSWSWSYRHTQDALAGYPGNKILNRFGIGILSSTMDGIIYKAPSTTEAEGYYHFRKALAQVTAHVRRMGSLAGLTAPWLDALARDCASYLRMGADQSPQYRAVLQELTQLVLKAGIPQVSKEHPIKGSSEKILLFLASELFKVLPDPGVLMSATGATLLHTVPLVHILIDGSNEGSEAWRSTGLYVPPGMKTTVCMPPAVIGKWWKVQVGCHTDNLGKKDELKRAPVVTQRFDISTERVTVSSLWGGLLYIVVPKGSQLGKVDVIVEDAVRAPYFRAGESSVSQWETSVRHYPAPWAELETDNVILTVPSESVRHLDDPEPLLSLWNRIMEGVAKLAATARRFPRPERIVADVQISAGWMHSGYPVMIHLGSVREIAQFEFMRSNGIWGPIHELGHNQQRALWEIHPHTTEATCNLWSVYIHENVLGMPRHEAHGQLTPDRRKQRIKDYINHGAKLDDWFVWTCLETYLQLQEGFGWEPFIQLFSDYQRLFFKNLDSTGKMNLWAEKFSQEVQRNLVPFFKAWGWPIEHRLVTELAKLPEWEENPMKSYY
ncbi:TCAF2 factor, partial [Amia calva]|nr:TCAF2 factor [Amia calva]